MPAPIRPEVKKEMKEIGQLIGAALPEGHGFVLCVFDFGQGGHMNYISNANRQDVTRALEELIQVLKGEN